MKTLITTFIALFFLTACSGSSDRLSDITAPSGQEQVAKKKKPRIPKKPVARAESVRADEQEVEADGGGVDMARLIEDINKSLGQDTITANEIEQGWYFAAESDKKTGTPDSWVWVEDGGDSRWSNPNATEVMDEAEKSFLCAGTGGTYIISCIEQDIENCEYVAQSGCRCLEDTVWIENQGCILTDEAGKTVLISDDELLKGFYKGEMSSKKLNTPSAWVWFENSGDSQWKNPSPR